MESTPMKANTIGLTLDTSLDFAFSLRVGLITPKLAIAKIRGFKIIGRNAIGPWLNRLVNQG